MLAEKDRDFQPHVVQLEMLVPASNFYRKLEEKLDLSFVRELVKAYYKPFGRPSIDPVVFFKLQLIMFFEGIRSERQLLETVAMRLDHRWYIGYDLNEQVPDHSSLSRIRDRYGLSVFQQFFERIVERCIEAGLVWGKELYFDATKVSANAALEGMIDRWYWAAKQHMDDLFAVSSETVQAPAIGSRFVTKYDGTRIAGHRAVAYKRVTDSRVSPTDPDASPMRSSTFAPTQLGYHTHYVVDGGKARIILSALVTPASVMENTPMLDLARWSRFRWQLDTEIAVGDTTYGTVANITGLEQDHIRAYLPINEFRTRTQFYERELFHYDTERDLFICPQGHELPLYKTNSSELEYVYRANRRTCDACPVKPACTDSKSGRTLRRSFFQDSLDTVKRYHKTEAYQKALRKRQVWVEPLFGEAKQWHQLQKFRLRGLIKVNIQALLTAAGQNIKRLLKRHHSRKNHPDPTGIAALLPPKCLLKTVFFVLNWISTLQNFY